MQIWIRIWALIKNKEKQTAATIKGVPNSYLSLINPDSVIYEGDFVLQEDGDNFAVVGAALASQIEAGVFFIRPISIYAPKHNTKVNLSQPERSFNERQIYISGVYAVNQQEIDSKFVFVSIDFARELFNYGSVASAIELKFKNGTNISKARKEISSILGDNYKLQNREEQHEDFYKMMKIEKWDRKSVV